MRWRAKCWVAVDEADARDTVADVCGRAEVGLQEVLDWMHNPANRGHLPARTLAYLTQRIAGAQIDLRRAREHAEGKRLADEKATPEEVRAWRKKGSVPWTGYITG